MFSFASGLDDVTAELAAHLPQLMLKRLRGVIQDGFNFVLHPPLSHCLQTFHFRSNHGVDSPHQLFSLVTGPCLIAILPTYHVGYHSLIECLLFFRLSTTLLLVPTSLFTEEVSNNNNNPYTCPKTLHNL